ncbi:MAG: enoyl-CoA hydratase/isomerase family protein [Candidatus Parcubacteria bacterium]|nr:enoyl-CoA hydratase/isomerase family protein [Burkholderiales bacterium]
MFRTLKLDIGHSVATVTLNRPEARNAMSAELMGEMIACAGFIAARRDVAVAIVHGSAACFSAGADLKDAKRWSNAAQPLDEQREIAALGYRMARAWEEVPQVTLAAIEGYAIGGGLALAAALDWRVMAEDAFVSLPEIALGIPLTWGTLPRLVNLLGPARAKRLTILCERIPADQALAMGLADWLAPRGRALRRAREIAAQVLALPRNSVRMSKESINAYASIGAHAASHMAHDQVQLAAGSAEARAAREAFALRKNKGASPARTRKRAQR